jgi:spore coat protein U-like protein
MFIEDIIVLTKCCRIFLVVLNVVVGRGERVGARLVINPIFLYLKYPLYSTTTPFDSPVHMF